MRQKVRGHLQAELRRLEAEGRILETVSLLLHEKDDPVATALHAAKTSRHAAEWASFREVRIAFERENGPLE